MKKPTVFTLLLFALLTVLSLVFVTCSKNGGGGERIRHVVLVTIDTLRADRLGCYGYERDTSPNLDRLAAGGALFENAQVPRGSTWPSLTSILTGKYPITHGVRKNGELLAPDHLTLPDLLRDEGFVTAGFHTNMLSSPNPGLDTRRAYTENLPQAELDRMATRDAVTWLVDNKDEENIFLWVHYIDPHKPYTPEPEFNRFVDPDFTFEIPEDYERLDSYKQHADRSELDEYLQYVMGKGVDLTDEQVAHVDALYDGEVLAVDHEIGILLGAIADLGLEDETLVVFTSDHGEEMYDRHHYFYHAASVYQGVLHVPFLVRAPGVVPAAMKVAAPVEVVDIAPTVFDMLGLDDPEAGFEGVSLVDTWKGGRRSRSEVYAEWSERQYLKDRRPIYVVRDGKWKFIYNPDGVHPSVPPFESYGSAFPIGVAELYDLDADPGETNNILARHGDKAAELRAKVEAFAAEKEANAGSADMSLKTLIEMIRLGYVDRDRTKKHIKKRFGITPEQLDDVLDGKMSLEEFEQLIEPKGGS